MRRRPERGRTHQEVAIAADADRDPPRVAGAQRERGANGMAGAGAEPAAAIRAEKIERMAERPPGAVPGERQMRERAGLGADRAAQRAGEVLDREGAVGERPVSLAHLPLSWNGAAWPFRHPLDYLGSDGGGGIGGGPGIAVGAALALRGSGRLPVAVCGDGDFLMGATALWTAAHYRIPLLVVIANNRSFYNDELHQERVAVARHRPVENKWIGQRMSEPEVDLAAMGRAQGAVGFGPIIKPADLAAALEKAIAEVDAGKVAVVDVRVEPGYTAVMTQAMVRGKS